MLACGIFLLLQGLWWQPRSMAKVRARTVERDSSEKFDAFLASRGYRWSHWAGLVGGGVLIVVGVLPLAGV
jgi:hypothetical protein